MPLAYWLPPALWMAAIMVFSSDVGSAQHTAHWLVPLLRLMAPSATPSQLAALHGLVRKAGHLTEYAVLATLWYRAFALGRRQPRRAAALTAFAISLGWAVLDEARQSLVPTRTATAMDVAIDRATTLLLWTALIGGIAFLVLNALTGVSSGILWLSVPVAAILLLARSIYARHHSPPRP